MHTYAHVCMCTEVDPGNISQSLFTVIFKKGLANFYFMEHVCLCHISMQYLRRPEEGTGLPRIGISYPLPHGCWEGNPGPLQAQPVLLTPFSSPSFKGKLSCWTQSASVQPVSPAMCLPLLPQAEIIVLCYRVFFRIFSYVDAGYLDSGPRAV